jgi:hypothetical protein
MAVRQLHKLVELARAKAAASFVPVGASADAGEGGPAPSALLHVSVVHRTGCVPVGQVAVVVAVSSPHRAASLWAVGWLVDELKAHVPLWKREVFEDGEETWRANCECARHKPGC